MVGEEKKSVEIEETKIMAKEPMNWKNTNTNKLFE